jgi:prophage regulatory protein
MASDMSQQGSPERLLAFDEVRSRIGLSRTTIWRLIKSGDFPASVQISAARRAWAASAIESWIASKLHRENSNDHRDGVSRAA